MYNAYLMLLLFALAACAFLLWPVRRQRLFCGVVTIAVLAGSFAGYRAAGEPEIVALMERHTEQLAEADAVIFTESARVEQGKDNLESQIRLGQAYAMKRDWKAAADAFKRAVLLSDGHPDLIMAYARAMIMSEDGNISDHSKQSLNMVILQKPDHAEARYYLAVRTLQDGETETAMRDMKALYGSLPGNSPVKAMIDAQIGRN
ncbi:MAG: hypothetical protein GC188_09640 [Alphaproteobacteria bacterium]|nr:hypothetical protein [Alphaproteobacteria bacterium]